MNARQWLWGMLLLEITLGADPARADIIAYYRFEEGQPNVPASGTGTILDSSGHNLNGTPVNGPVYRTDVPANPVPQTGAPNNLSLQFDGISQRVTIPDNPLFQLTHSLTLEAYIKPTADTAFKGQILFRGDDRIGLDPYYLATQPGRQVEFFIQDAHQNGAFVTATLPALNQWHHVAGTLDDGTGKLSIYVDGVLQNSTITSVRPLDALDPSQNPGLGIGNVESATYSQYFPGLIDEVRISDTALQPSQFLNAVPEPSSIILVITGSLGAIGYRWRRLVHRAT